MREQTSKTDVNCQLDGKTEDSVKIIPLGGLEQIGMNMTIFEYQDEIIIIDCGMAFLETICLGLTKSFQISRI